MFNLKMLKLKLKNIINIFCNY